MVRAFSTTLLQLVLLDTNYSDIIGLLLVLGFMFLAAILGLLLWGTRQAVRQRSWFQLIVFLLLAAGLLLFAVDLCYG